MTTKPQNQPAAETERRVCSGVEIICPWCDSKDVSVVSPFGGSVPEVLMQCNKCEANFGWMKWHSKGQKPQ